MPTVLETCPLAFDATAHAYELFGKPVPSVTQALKASGYITFDGVPPGVLEHARDRGSRVHQALHFLAEDDLDEGSIDPEIAGYVESARRYLAAHVPAVLRAEMRVWSQRHRCAGTLDLLARHADGYLFVGDFKTGDPSDVAADLQLAAYQGFLLEMAAVDLTLDAELRSGGPLVLRRRSIRLFRDGREARETPYDNPRDYPRFLAALAVAHDQQARPTPSVAWDDER